MTTCRSIRSLLVLALTVACLGCGDAEPTAAARQAIGANPAERGTDDPKTRSNRQSSRFTSTNAGTQNAKAKPTIDSPRFRGPNGAGVSTEKGLPTKWSGTENIAWKRKLPGPGASCPIVVGDRIYLTCYSAYGLSKSSPGDRSKLKRHLVCLERKSGKIVWDQSVAFDRPCAGYGGFVALHGYASSTPVSDGDRIYAFFGNWGAYAFDKDGKQLWRFDCGSRNHGFGTGASPILHGKLLIVNASVESGTIYALNKTTGKEVWRATGIRDAWNTPLVVKASGRDELIVAIKGAVLGIDPVTGKSLWKWSGGGSSYVCQSWVPGKGVLYGMSSNGGPLAAINPGGTGDVTRSHTVWTNRRFRTTVLSPVYSGGHLYYVHDHGSIGCFDGKTGTEKKRARFRPASGTIYASPLAADGKIFVATRSRGTFVFKATPELEQLAHNTIAGDDSIFNACPVAHNGQLLLRSDKFLYCIGKRK